MIAESVPIGKIAIWGGIMFGILIIIGIIFFFYWIGKGKKYPFILYSRDGRTISYIKGVLKTDKANKQERYFYFENVKDRLDFKPPSKWVKGKAYREITYDDLGGYTYVTMPELNREEYLKVSLEPEEKSIALARMKEIDNRYQNPMNKFQAIALISGFILIFLLIVGIIYSTIAFAGVATDMVTMSKENTEIARINAKTTEANQQTAEQLAAMVSALTNRSDIVRQVD